MFLSYAHRRHNSGGSSSFNLLKVEQSSRSCRVSSPRVSAPPSPTSILKWDSHLQAEDDEHRQSPPREYHRGSEGEGSGGSPQSQPTQPQGQQQRRSHAHQFLNYVIIDTKKNGSKAATKKSSSPSLEVFEETSADRTAHYENKRKKTNESSNVVAASDSAQDFKDECLKQLQESSTIAKFTSSNSNTKTNEVVLSAFQMAAQQTSNVDTASPEADRLRHYQSILVNIFSAAEDSNSSPLSAPSDSVKKNMNEVGIESEGNKENRLNDNLALVKDRVETEYDEKKQEIIKNCLRGSKQDHDNAADDDDEGSKDPFEMIWKEDSDHSRRTMSYCQDNPQQQSFSDDIDMALLDEPRQSSSDVVLPSHLLHQQQQDVELQYLRLVVKNLVQSIDELVVEQQHQEKKLRQEENVALDKSDLLKKNTGIPTKIEFDTTEQQKLMLRRRMSELSSPNDNDGVWVFEDNDEDDDDVLDDESTLTISPSEHQHMILSNLSSSVPQDEYYGNIGAVPVEFIPYLPTTLNPEVEDDNVPSSSLTDTNPQAPPVQQMYSESSQQLLRYKQHQQVATADTKPTVLQLENGEIRDNKARNMKVQMDIKGKFVRGKYTGNLERGVPHGNGVLRLENRDLYIGEFFMGFFHGEGTYFCKSRASSVNARGYSITSRRRKLRGVPEEQTLTVLRGYFEYNEYIGTTKEMENDGFVIADPEDKPTAAEI